MSIPEQLGFKKRKHVGIAVSANNFIELVCIDKMTKTVEKYSYDNIKYNNSIREIVDYDEFAEVIETLFKDVGLEPQECCVTLSLPNVHFGITSLDGTTETRDIVEDIQSDIEDLYIFKRNEPAISYSILDNGITKGQKNIVFSAMQTKVVAKILEIFDKMNIDIVRIDTAYSSLFKAIQFCDKFNKMVAPEEKTVTVLITPNSCCGFFFAGPVIADVIEEPLAVKSFTSEEVYSAVLKLANNSILKNSPGSLLIISETDEVDSRVVAQRLKQVFTGEVECINKSVNNNEPFIDINELTSDVDPSIVAYMTIEAVGAAVSDYDEYPFNTNFVPAERLKNNIVNVGAYEIEFTKYVIFVIAGALVISCLLAFLINTAFSLYKNATQDNNAKMKEDIFHKNKIIEENEIKSKVDILPIMTQIVNRNKNILETYKSLASDIPDSIYIQRFIAQSNGGIGILGEAKSSESVQFFVDNLKEKNNELMLTKLSINAQNENNSSKIPDGYTFEIKTPNTNINFESAAFQNQLSINKIENKVKGIVRPPSSPII